jgi:opacity protein-like surface antigen
MRFRLALGLAGALALAIGLTSIARAEEHDFNRPGAYAGLGGVYAVSAFQGSLKDLVGNSMGFQARGGYRFNEYFALEGLYEYIDDFGAKRGSGGIWTNHASVNGKLILPLDRFQPYLSGGMGFLNANPERGSESLWAVAGRFSGGTDIVITEHVALFLDAAYLIPAGSGVASDLQYFSFGWGAKYLF